MAQLPSASDYLELEEPPPAFKTMHRQKEMEIKLYSLQDSERKK